MPSPIQRETRADYVTGAAVLQAMGFSTGFIDPNNATTPTAIDYSGTQYGYVRNDYIGVVQGAGGSYSVAYPSPLPEHLPSNGRNAFVW